MSNNGAAALILALRTLAFGRTVLVSRGELVEIGGGFRIPEILESAGGVLVEVGSTNRTRLEDYRAAAAKSDPAMILKVHRSNFRITGFTEEASLEDLVGLGAELGVPVVHDQGSGLLVDPERLGLPPEPRPTESLSVGADIVAFSGDKLLGGPQAGILLGKAEWVDQMRKNPLCRAVRVDKTALAGLEATLQLYRDPEDGPKGDPGAQNAFGQSGGIEGTGRCVGRRPVGCGCHVRSGRDVLDRRGRYVPRRGTRELWGSRGGGGGRRRRLGGPATKCFRTPRRARGRQIVLGRSPYGASVAGFCGSRPTLPERRALRQGWFSNDALQRAPMTDGPRRAIFLDRDGTLTEERVYLSDPEGVVLLPGTAAALSDLRDARFTLVVVTNQSGIARGLYSEDDYYAVAKRLDDVLAEASSPVDATLYCPHHPDFGPACECRKPATGMYRRAAAELGVDLADSYYVGDKVTDVTPALELGGVGVLVRTGYGADEAARVPAGMAVAEDLGGVRPPHLERWLGGRGRGVDPPGGLG